MSLRMGSNNPTSTEGTASRPVVWAAVCAAGISQMPVVLGYFHRQGKPPLGL